MGIDVDAYAAAHREDWRRLEKLCARRTLSGPESDELVELYRRCGAQLATLETTGADALLVGRLSELIARARGVVTGAQTPVGHQIAAFFVHRYPAALYASRRWWGSVAALFVLVSAFVSWQVASHPARLNALVGSARVRQLVDHDFADYYKENPARDFALQVWTNNALVAAGTLVVGVLLVPTFVVLWQNAVNVGVDAGAMIGHGRADVFFGLITPHGLLELTTVFIAAGAGLRLGWAWIAPPPALTRLQSFARTGRATIGMTIGLTCQLLVSGIIEAFVTPSPLPTWARIGIGVVAEGALVVYVFTLGRWAYAAGETGDLAPDERDATAPTAD